MKWLQWLKVDTYFAKRSITDFWQGPKCTPQLHRQNSCSCLETLHTKAFLMNGKLPRNSPLTLFFPKFPFVPPKNIKKPLIYWYFQGDQQGTLGIKSLTETFWKKKLQTLCMQLYFKRPLLKVLSSKFCASTKTSSESLKQTPDVTRDCLSIWFHSPIMISTTQI